MFFVLFLTWLIHLSLFCCNLPLKVSVTIHDLDPFYYTLNGPFKFPFISLHQAALFYCNFNLTALFELMTSTLTQRRTLQCLLSLLDSQSNIPFNFFTYKNKDVTYPQSPHGCCKYIFINWGKCVCCADVDIPSASADAARQQQGGWAVPVDTGGEAAAGQWGRAARGTEQDVPHSPLARA